MLRRRMRMDAGSNNPLVGVGGSFPRPPVVGVGRRWRWYLVHAGHPRLGWKDFHSSTPAQRLRRVDPVCRGTVVLRCNSHLYHLLLLLLRGWFALSAHHSKSYYYSPLPLLYLEVYHGMQIYPIVILCHTIRFIIYLNTPMLHISYINAYACIYNWINSEYNFNCIIWCIL